MRSNRASKTSGQSHARLVPASLRTSSPTSGVESAVRPARHRRLVLSTAARPDSVTRGPVCDVHPKRTIRWIVVQPLALAILLFKPFGTFCGVVGRLGGAYGRGRGRHPANEGDFDDRLPDKNSHLRSSSVCLAAYQRRFCSAWTRMRSTCLAARSSRRTLARSASRWASSARRCSRAAVWAFMQSRTIPAHEPRRVWTRCASAYSSPRNPHRIRPRMYRTAGPSRPSSSQDVGSGRSASPRAVARIRVVVTLPLSSGSPACSAALLMI